MNKTDSHFKLKFGIFKAPVLSPELLETGKVSKLTVMSNTLV
jgi:hypothetical protein